MVDSNEKHWALNDGYMCSECQKPFGCIVAQRAFVSYSTEQMKELIEFQKEQNKLLAINKDLYNSLNITKVIENVIHLDESKKNGTTKLQLILLKLI